MYTINGRGPSARLALSSQTTRDGFRFHPATIRDLNMLHSLSSQGLLASDTLVTKLVAKLIQERYGLPASHPAGCAFDHRA